MLTTSDPSSLWLNSLDIKISNLIEKPYDSNEIEKAPINLKNIPYKWEF